MTDERDENGRLLTDGERLTRPGRFLRKTSMDPQITPVPSAGATPVPSSGATPVKFASLLIDMNFTGQTGQGGADADYTDLKNE
jgi:hypothetical protein